MWELQVASGNSSSILAHLFGFNIPDMQGSIVKEWLSLKQLRLVFGVFFCVVFGWSHHNTLVWHLFHMALCHDDSLVIVNIWPLTELIDFFFFWLWVIWVSPLVWLWFELRFEVSNPSFINSVNSTPVCFTFNAQSLFQKGRSNVQTCFILFTSEAVKDHWCWWNSRGSRKFLTYCMTIFFKSMCHVLMFSDFWFWIIVCTHTTITKTIGPTRSCTNCKLTKLNSCGFLHTHSTSDTYNKIRYMPLPRAFNCNWRNFYCCYGIQSAVLPTCAY